MYGTRVSSNSSMNSSKQSGCAAVQQPANRRALGDIGNLVVERPMTRRYAKELLAQKPPAAPVSVAATVTNQVHAAPNPHPARVKALLQKRPPVARKEKEVVKKEKEPTLTAQLTARSEAACRGFDAEMIDIEEQLPNIDANDVGNPLHLTDYVEDIYSFYRKAEVQSCVAPDYMSLQSDINDKMRAILVDWLIEVHLKFKLMPETLFLTVNIIDRYLATQTVSRKYLQLVGVTAMLVAAKYEEIWAPEVHDFELITDHAYTKDQVLSMEKKMLNTLRFNLTVPTPYVFVSRFLKAASADRQMNLLAFYYVELCLTEYVMLKYPPSMLSAAAVYAAQCCLKKAPVWNTLLQRHTGYTEDQVRGCASQMARFQKLAAERVKNLKEDDDNSLTVVHRKYSHEKFLRVAELSPAKQLLHD